MSKITPIRQVIYATRYAEFPEFILTLDLAIAAARADGRKVKDALKHCAGMLARRARNKRLRDHLENIATTNAIGGEANTLMAIRHCLDKMERELTKEFKREGVDLSDARAMMLAYEKEVAQP